MHVAIAPCAALRQVLLAALSTAPLPQSAAPPAEQHGWPWWRGPERNGVSSEVGWSSAGAEEPLWKREVGCGHSSVSIVEGRLYTLGFMAEDGMDVIWCLDARSGEELWAFPYPAELDADGHGGGTHTTPTIADGRVYCTERRGSVRALDARTGELLWSRELIPEEEVRPTEYGFGGSPLVLGELVVVNAASVLALDRASGKTVWKTRDLTAYYSTPEPWRLDGKDVVASFGREGLFVLDLASGEERRFFPWRKGSTSVNASTPVIVDERRVFISSGYGHGGALVDLSAQQPVALWESQAIKTQLTGCVLVGDFLYGFDEGVLKCLDLAGKERWRKRGHGMGALMAADARLIVITSKGELVIAAADPAEYTEHSLTRVLDGSTFWATPVLCGGLIYCRSGEGTLVCLDHRPGAGER